MSPREHFEAARSLWPAFLPKQLDFAAMTVILAVHRGSAINEDEFADVLYVTYSQALPGSNQFNPRTVVVASSPMVRVADLTRCICTAGFRHPFEQAEPRLSLMLANPWVVTAVMAYIKNHKQKVHEVLMSDWVSRSGGKQEDRPPMPRPYHTLSFLSHKLRSVMDEPR
jgi:hypothetical protein